VVDELIRLQKETNALLRRLLKAVEPARQELYNVRQAAAFMGVTPATVRQWIKDGRLVSSKPTGADKQARHTLRREDLERLQAG
jgi:excisionase family DNA binding protein